MKALISFIIILCFAGISLAQPVGLIVINKEEYTTSRYVELKIAAVDNLSGIAEMCVSNTADSCYGWQSYKTSLTWALTEGNGLKTVCVKFRDNAGNEMSSPVCDTVTLVGQ